MKLELLIRKAVPFLLIAILIAILIACLFNKPQKEGMKGAKHDFHKAARGTKHVADHTARDFKSSPERVAEEAKEDPAMFSAHLIHGGIEGAEYTAKPFEDIHPKAEGIGDGVSLDAGADGGENDDD
jgi:hypothetical protein